MRDFTLQFMAERFSNHNLPQKVRKRVKQSQQSKQEEEEEEESNHMYSSRGTSLARSERRRAISSCRGVRARATSAAAAAARESDVPVSESVRRCAFLFDTR
jgi:Mrp family chromosome partitioning ATPase